MVVCCPGGYSWIFLVGRAPPGSPNPDPISDQKVSFFAPVLRPGPYEIMSSLLKLEKQQKRFLKIHFEFSCFSFFLTHLELKQKYVRTCHLPATAVPLKTIPGSRPKWAKSIPVFRPKGRKTPGKNPTRWGGTYLYGLYREVPPPPPRQRGFVNNR